MSITNILYIAPIPPPATGNSIISQELLQILSNEYSVNMVDTSHSSLISGQKTTHRIRTLLSVLMKIARFSKYCDVVYLSSSLSMYGNMKDLLIYFILHMKLDRTVIHLHGGGIKTHVFDKNVIIKYLNKYYLRKLAGVIVLSESLKENYSGMVSQKNIHVLPNFVDERVISRKGIVNLKHSTKGVIEILYLSNMFADKGYMELCQAVGKYNEGYSRKAICHLAGEFTDEAKKKIFISYIMDKPFIVYHGVLQLKAKRQLLSQCHAFCLPTYHKHSEGQPLSIMEAFANKCIVITTSEGGIKDFVHDGKNGYIVEPRSVTSIVNAIKTVATDGKELNHSIIERNYSQIKNKYSKERFVKDVKIIFSKSFI
jgi:glycosyltransferase involved in cell wall biosynthesis